MTKVEAAKLTQDMMLRGVIETIITESMILELLPFMEVTGTAVTYNREATLPAATFYDVGDTWTEATPTFTQVTAALKILGGDADVDRFLQQTRSNLNDQRATQTAMKVKAARMQFQDAFFNGDTAVEAREFDGLKKRLVGGQVIDAATNGLSVLGASDADRHAFLDKLDELIASVRGEVAALFMNKTIRMSLRSSARRLGRWDMTRGEFGQSIELYDGIRIIDPGDGPDGTAVLPQTETQGASAVASSIYAVALSSDEAEPGVAGLTNGGVQVYDLGELQDKPAYRTRIEFYTGIAVFGKGAARLRGVLK